MIFFKYLLLWGGIAMIVAAIAIIARDIYLQIENKKKAAGEGAAPTGPALQLHWRGALALVLLAVLPITLASGIVVVPSGMGGVRISQTSGTLPGTLYPGAHLLTPLAETVALFDTRDQLFTTGSIESAKPPEAKQAVEPLRVQAKEGLPVDWRSRSDTA